MRVFFRQNVDSGFSLFQKLREQYNQYKTQQLLLKSMKRWVEANTDSNYRIHTNFFGGEKIFQKNNQQGIERKPFTFIALYNESLEMFLDRASATQWGARWTQDEWTVIYSSHDFSFFISKDLPAENLQLAGIQLSKSDQLAALRVARKAAEVFVKKGRSITQKDLDFPVPEVFTQYRAIIDVSIWSQGILRASKISRNEFLLDALVNTGIAATHDSRFKPLTTQELEDMYIELFIFSSYFRPLSLVETMRRGVDFTKGYTVHTEKKIGWYLPSVFNTSLFMDAQDYLVRFFVKKVGIPRNHFASSSLYNFELVHFVESSERKESLVMDGPIVNQNLLSATNEELRKRCDHAASWLVRRQGKDGYTSSIVDPQTGRVQNSWPRIPAAALWLAHYGQKLNKFVYVDSSMRTLEFMKAHVDMVKSHTPENFLTRLYFCRLGLFLGDEEVSEQYDTLVVREYLERIEPIRSEFNGTILLLQVVSSYLFDRKQFDKKNHTLAHSIFNDIYALFEESVQNNRVISLAQYAEIVAITYKLSRADEYYKEKYLFAKEWYKEQQNNDGSFPNFSNAEDSMPYTRGTGKIFEVLSFDQDNSTASIAALRWLLNLQYTNENIFYTPVPVRPMVLGGIRHDYRNYQLWTDSVGHVLMGASQLFGKQVH